MKLVIKEFNELTNTELYEIIRARLEIFFIEQKMYCRDLDGIDYRALHCFLEEGGQIVAYLRAYVLEDRPDVVKIGRVLSMKHGVGIGRKLMQAALPQIIDRLHCKTIFVSAQKQAVGFYQKIGFSVISDEFLEEGVLHVNMELNTNE